MAEYVILGRVRMSVLLFKTYQCCPPFQVIENTAVFSMDRLLCFFKTVPDNATGFEQIFENEIQLKTISKNMYFSPDAYILLAQDFYSNLKKALQCLTYEDIKVTREKETNQILFIKDTHSYLKILDNKIEHTQKNSTETIVTVPEEVETLISL